MILDLVKKWREGVQVVWAAREGSAGTGSKDRLSSRFYHFVMRRAIHMHQFPAYGADFVLVDRVVMSALSSHPEKNFSLFALISWMGFRQAAVSYKRSIRRPISWGWAAKGNLQNGV